MNWCLSINLYTQAGVPVESFGQRFDGLGVRCDLPGWLQKLWFNTPTRHGADASNRLKTHQGLKAVVFDNLNTVIATADVRAVRRIGRLVRYECTGAWERHNDEFYTTEIDPAWSVRTLLRSMISNSVPAVHENAANFVNNGTAVGEYGAQAILDGPGLRVRESIPELLDISDSSGNIYDYWVQPRPFLRGFIPQKDAAYYQIRSETGNADFTVTQGDLEQSAAEQEAHIYRLATSFQVRPGHLVGTATSTGIDLVDSTAPFLAAGVKSGDVVVNKTKSISMAQKIWCYVATVNEDGDTCGTRLNEGQGWSSGDAYDIEMQDATAISSPVSAAASYWDVETEIVEAPAMNTAQAAQFAARLVNTFSKPIRQQPITIGGPYLTGAAGGRWPLWYALRRPCRIRVQDEEDSRASLTFSLGSNHGLFSVSVDYDHDQRLLRVTPNSASDRLDKLLQLAGVVHGQTVDAGHRKHGHGQVVVGPGGIPWWLDRNARNQKYKEAGQWDPAWIGDESAAPTGW